MFTRSKRSGRHFSELDSETGTSNGSDARTITDTDIGLPTLEESSEDMLKEQMRRPRLTGGHGTFYESTSDKDF